MLAEVQPNATTSRCMSGRISSAAGAMRSRIARSVSGVMSASLNRRAAYTATPGRRIRLAELVLHGLVGRQHQQPDRGACGDALVQRAGQHAEIGEIRAGVHRVSLPSSR